MNTMMNTMMNTIQIVRTGPAKVLRLALAAGALFGAATARANTIQVPTTQYPTIQSGIDAAAPGDDVVVADGYYTGSGNIDLSFGGKDITLRSASGDPNRCFINCEYSGICF